VGSGGGCSARQVIWNVPNNTFPSEGLSHSIRQRIVDLIFKYPYSSQAQSLDGHLWLDTSHALISLYRERLAALDHQQNTPGNSQGPKKSNVVETRKLLAKFRTFLAAEEKFWSEIALRVVRTYGLDEAKPALYALNITVPDPIIRSTDISEDHPLAPSGDQTAQVLQSETPSPTQREKKLEMVHKVLIRLGDLARYREQYNETAGKPKAGQVESSDERGKSRRGRRGGGTGAASRRGTAEVVTRPRDYSKAAECYNQARLLIPDNG